MAVEVWQVSLVRVHLSSASHLVGVASCFIASKDVELGVDISAAEARQVRGDVSGHPPLLPDGETRTKVKLCDTKQHWKLFET